MSVFDKVENFWKEPPPGGLPGSTSLRRYHSTHSLHRKKGLKPPREEGHSQQEAQRQREEPPPLPPPQPHESLDHLHKMKWNRSTVHLEGRELQSHQRSSWMELAGSGGGWTGTRLLHRLRKSLRSTHPTPSHSLTHLVVMGREEEDEDGVSTRTATATLRKDRPNRGGGKCQSGDSGIDLEEPTLVPPPSSAALPSSSSQVAKVLEEILQTERKYLKTLGDIVEGFLLPSSSRPDLFSPTTISHIFTNIQELFSLHIPFLQELSSSSHDAGAVGEVFSSWGERFAASYSTYCSRHPLANATLKRLGERVDYEEFFEACRRAQRMDKLPLHGFLLRPIQRICQYHLQLSQLLKHTEDELEEGREEEEEEGGGGGGGGVQGARGKVRTALETMKKVANDINNTQREFDELVGIERVQGEIEGWIGSDLISRNNRLLMKGRVGKLCFGKRTPKSLFCFLFNNDLVTCRKDPKGGALSYEGRIDLRQSPPWVNIGVGECDEYFGFVEDAWRLYCPALRNWVLFTSADNKEGWIRALEERGGAGSQSHQPSQEVIRMAKLTHSLNREILKGGGGGGPHPRSNTLPRSSKLKGGVECKLKRSSHTSSVIAGSRAVSQFYV